MEIVTVSTYWLRENKSQIAFALLGYKHYYQLGLLLRTSTPTVNKKSSLTILVCFTCCDTRQKYWQHFNLRQQ